MLRNITIIANNSSNSIYVFSMVSLQNHARCRLITMSEYGPAISFGVKDLFFNDIKVIIT